MGSSFRSNISCFVHHAVFGKTGTIHGWSPTSLLENKNIQELKFTCWQLFQKSNKVLEFTQRQNSIIMFKQLNSSYENIM